MDIQEKRSGRTLALYFSGEADQHGVRDSLRRVDSAIDAALPQILILDFSGVTFMDSSGIALILRARDRIRLADGVIQVQNVPAQAKRVLDAAGISRLIPIR